MDPPLCARGCGFFGSVTTQNLCSKCYKDYLKEEAAAAESYVLALPAPTTTNQSAMINPSSSATIKNKCICCKKKVGMVGFGCRCGGTFCAIHRYPEEHACKFDFKNLGRAVLSKENPLCKADKLESRF